MLHRIQSVLLLRAWHVPMLALVLLVGGLASQRAHAQILTGNINRVGGISIDPAGMVTAPEKSARIALRDELRKLHATPATELNQATELRLFSLKRLEAAVRELGATTAEKLPDDLRFLAGIQRIQYVLVYPEEHDIVLAGPGEGWLVNEEGNIVGQTTGRPVLRLEDLLVALRSVENARQGGISCSIDPTAEGRQRLEAVLAKKATYSSGLLEAIKRALGKQEITLVGVPPDSHFARVLVSSDYHMKRIAMRLEPTPLKELPSFIDMLKRENAQLDNMMPRWWMANAGEPLGRSDDGLAFELPAQRVKCFTEDEVADSAGKVSGTGAVNPIAQQWADAMTKHYDELAVKEAAFGDLRNVMDMCVVGALIAKEQLLAKADCQLPTLMAKDSPLGVQSAHTPKHVETQCSSIKRGQEYIVTASGGVSIASWQAVQTIEPRPAIGQVRSSAQARSTAKPSSASQAWWNASR
jgi:Protein of unknown function (DUF1598)